jgi:hypothetical protein
LSSAWIPSRRLTKILVIIGLWDAGERKYPRNSLDSPDTLSYSERTKDRIFLV